MPRIARPADFMTGLFLVALAALVFAQASGLPMGSALRMGAGYVPRLLGFLLAGFGVVLIGLSLRGSQEPTSRWALRPLACVLLVPVVFAFAVDRFGLLITVVACTLVAVLGSREGRPLEALVLGAALAVFAVALFVWGLAIPMQPLPG